MNLSGRYNGLYYDACIVLLGRRRSSQSGNFLRSRVELYGHVLITAERLNVLLGDLMYRFRIRCA